MLFYWKEGDINIFPRAITMGNCVIVVFISEVLKDLLFLKLDEILNTSFFINNISLIYPNDIRNELMKTATKVGNSVIML